VYLKRILGKEDSNCNQNFYRGTYTMNVKCLWMKYISRTPVGFCKHQWFRIADANCTLTLNECHLARLQWLPYAVCQTALPEKLSLEPGWLHQLCQLPLYFGRIGFPEGRFPIWTSRTHGIPWRDFRMSVDTTFTSPISTKYLDRREMKWREVGENCIMRNFITCTLLQV
jgi:hypothetical protein